MDNRSLGPGFPKVLQQGLALSGQEHSGHLSAEEVGQIPLFANVSDIVLEVLFQQQRTLSIGAGETLVMQSDWGESVIVLLEGIAKVRCFNGDGEELVLALVGPGDILGEIAVLDGGTRSADVISMSPARFLKIPSRSFVGQLNNCPTLCLNLARLQAQRLRDLNARFAMQRSDATSRVLFALAYIASKSDAKHDPLSYLPPLAQGEIAIIAGMARETASRVMSKLRSKGDVVGEAGRIRLSSLSPLRKRGLWA